MTHLPLLLTISLVMVLSLVGLGLNFLRADARERRLGLRLDRAAGGLTVTESDLAPKARFTFEWFRRPLAITIGFLGVDPVRAPDYPLPWWVVVIALFILGRGLVFLAAMLVGGVGLILWPVLSMVMSRLAFGAIHARRSGVLLSQFPDALATIVRCVRVGIPVQEALRIIARDMPKPTAQEFARLADQVSIGTPLDQALVELAERSRLPEYGFFSTALSLQARSGGGLAQTLETLAEVIRKRVAMKARGYALASEARTSALILGAIPIVAGLGIEIIQPKYLAVLFVTHKGRIIFGMAIGMLLLGTLTMRTIIHRSLR